MVYFLAKHKISVLEHPVYSPDFGPSDFFLFSNVKLAVKGTIFETVKTTVKINEGEEMNMFSENGFYYCFY